VNARRTRSKALATWLAFAGGSLGLHRFYLHGWRDRLGWLLPWPTLLGVYGVVRMREFGQDDRLAWLLVPLLGLMLAGTMLVAILHGLMPDEKWNERYNPQGVPQRTGWVTVIGVILSLALGATALLSTIAFVGQRAVEVSLDRPSHAPQGSTPRPTQ
jgi:hypothetical protein